MKIYPIPRNLYSSIHHWLKYHYGKADKCENKECNKTCKTFTWAKKRGVSYDYNRKHFIKLCRSCHSKYDFTEKTFERMRQNNLNAKKKICKNGHKLSKDNVYLPIKGKGRWRHCRICKKNNLRKPKVLKKKKAWNEKNINRVREYSRNHARRKFNVKPENYRV